MEYLVIADCLVLLGSVVKVSLGRQDQVVRLDTVGIQERLGTVGRVAILDKADYPVRLDTVE